MARLPARLIALVLLAADPAVAQETPPLPPTRPAELKPEPLRPQEAKPDEAKPQDANPEAKPETKPAETKPAEPATPPEAAKPPEPSLPNIKVTGDAACQERLTRLGAAFKARPSIKEGQCAVDNALDLSSLGPGRPLTPTATLACPQAEMVVRWFSEVVVPAAKTHLNAEAAGIGQASAYVCRNRNHAAAGKLSEHAFGNALDIASITFSGGRKAVAVEPKAPDTAEEKAFLAEIRRGACAYFTTVLGPGADAAHETHLHLDNRARTNGYRICE